MTIVTVFRSRLRDGVGDRYEPVADEMSRLVSSIDGFVDQKSYVAGDGERVTVVRFRDWESHHEWAHHPAHRVAQQRGRDEFYSWYDISIAEESRAHVYTTSDAPSP